MEQSLENQEKSISELEKEYSQICYKLIKNLQTIHERQTANTETLNPEASNIAETRDNGDTADMLTSIQLNLLTTLPMMKAMCTEDSNKFDDYLHQLSELVHNCDVELMKRVDSMSNNLDLLPSDPNNENSPEKVKKTQKLIQSIKQKLQAIHSKDNKFNTHNKNRKSANKVSTVAVQELINLIQANCGDL